MTPPRGRRHACRIIHTDHDDTRPSHVTVDCPNRDEKPTLAQCMDCGAFVCVAGTLAGDEVVVVCTPRPRDGGT